MVQKTFTEILIDFLINGDMPSKKGKEATESGLIVLVSKMATPVCASYGSSKDMALAIAAAIEQNEPIRLVIMSAVTAYAVRHPEDEFTRELKRLIKNQT